MGTDIEDSWRRRRESTPDVIIAAKSDYLPAKPKPNGRGGFRWTKQNLNKQEQFGILAQKKNGLVKIFVKEFVRSC